MDDETQVDPTLEENEEFELDLGNEEEEQESVEDIRARLAKAEELANNYKTRAEKAEAKAKTSTPAKKDTDIPSTDLYSLMKAQVPQEDVQEVLRAAKILNLSVADALKSNVVKTILSDNAEMRRSAEVAATGSARRATTKQSPDALLDKARNGDLPDDDDSIARLVEAQIEARRGTRH